MCTGINATVHCILFTPCSLFRIWIWKAVPVGKRVHIPGSFHPVQVAEFEGGWWHCHFGVGGNIALNFPQLYGFQGMWQELVISYVFNVKTKQRNSLLSIMGFGDMQYFLVQIPPTFLVAQRTAASLERRSWLYSLVAIAPWLCSREVIRNLEIMIWTSKSLS